MPSGQNVIGVGAVNLDYIISQPPSKGVVPPAIERFDFGSERGITNREAEALLAELASLAPVFSPGGSALNTVASLAAMETDLSVGYVGLCGRAAAPGFSFPQWFETLGINTDQLLMVDELAGTCISLTRDGQRSLLTTPGANANIMSYFEDRADALVQYLATASVVLFTSFANLEDVRALVDLVRRLRAASPEVLICCDPGAMWAVPPVPDGVPELLALADWVLVNQQEYELTGLAERKTSATVVVKEPTQVRIITGDPDNRVTEHHRNPLVLTADEIVDDTGTGDAFAAGLIWALATPDATVTEGVQLGMALAVEKLRWPGLGGLHRYRDVATAAVRRSPPR